MLEYNKLFNLNSQNLQSKKKNKIFLFNQKKLSIFHYKNSKEYKLICDSFFQPVSKIKNLSYIPYIHVSLFKNFNLISKNKNEKLSIFKSSGTTGKERSKIYLDYKTSILQSKTLEKIFKNIINKDNDIFFLESKNFFTSNEIMTAKGAAIKGFSQLCNKKYFLLDKYNNLNLSILKEYLKNNKEKQFIIFGFTSSVWFNLILQMKKKKIKLKKNQGILIHGGGWKKMHKIMINDQKFQYAVKDVLGLKNVYNYYGMIEQTGSIFLQCQKGYFHTSIFSDILIRNSKLDLCKINEPGLIQSFSLLPVSYPGHSILTEDVGVVHGIDDCMCGAKGKYFSVLGRAPETELRGCSDVN